MNTMSPFTDLKHPSPLELSVNIKDVDLSIVNAVRRVVLSEVPNVGFLFDPEDLSDEEKLINVIENDTPLHNELIQQRIALVPIHVNVEELENWNLEDYRFEIVKTNSSNQPLPVYTSDIAVYDADNTIRPDIAKRFFPADPISKSHILLTKIKASPGAKLHVVAKAVTNIARNFASFGLVSNCAVEFVVDEEQAKKQLVQFLEQHKEKDTPANLKHKFDTLERERHYERNRYREPNHFVFRMTSECSIPCDYIFAQAVGVLKSKIAAFQKSEYGVLRSNDLYTVVVSGETHTLGNLFQALCFNHYIRDDADNTEFGLRYIGYNVPHPLERVVVFKLKGDGLTDVAAVQAFVAHATDVIYKILTDFETQWNEKLLSNK